MSISLLDIYNSVASQAWSMFDNDATDTDDFDPVLISAINKALIEIWCSYPFDFRLKNKTIITQNYINKYNLPDGAILSKHTYKGDRYAVTLARKYLDFIEDPNMIDLKFGKPEFFFIKNNYIGFYPAPDKMYKINVDYLSFAVGVDANDNPIYALREDSDKVIIPDKFSQLFLNALISKALMYALASPSDENYSGYAIQFEKAYNILIKAVGGRKKHRKIIF